MSNRLAEASSPYLRQHADNPVDWYPWDEEALHEARDSGRPILLSIGYAACHWCHVMAHESFEDPATAALMNRLYVNIKVDREERPDLDKLYQTAQMLLTQRGGGWPLTLFLTPDKRVPFFGGTYFPPEPRHGLPAFSQILERVAEWYGEHAEELDKQNESVCAALQQIHQSPQAIPWPERLEADVIEDLARAFDARDGGFGGAPKFARPTQLQWLQQQDNPRAQHMATHTLSCMAEGGIQDHAGGGFYRYSVDAHWMIPHFEKMLYDQALLLPLYAEAWTRTESLPLRTAAAGIVSFVTRELQDESGGFYSSLDADSEGEEGKFYLWTPEEVQGLIPEEHYPAFAFRFGLDRPANFEGRWHLHGFRTMLETAANTKQPVEELQGMFEQDLQRLFEARSVRVRPGLDDKMLTSWNALMIRGLILASRQLGEPDWFRSAAAAFDFVRQRLWDGQRLKASFSQGKAHLNAYLDDYAFMLEAALLLLQGRWSNENLEFAEQLAGVIAEQFADPDGGLFFTSHDHEELLVRPRLLADDVAPSGCAVACEGLIRIGHLLARSEWVELAERTLAGAQGAIVQAPQEHARFMEARFVVEQPPAQIILRGNEPELGRWKSAAWRGDLKADCYAIREDTEDLPPALQDKPAQGEAVAYVCIGPTCEEPIRSYDAFKERVQVS